jgi:cobalamin biosynthetic protein CobC
MLEHGGRIAEAAVRYGIAASEWLDLSTGISPRGYPVPVIPASAWQRLPEDSDCLAAVAREYYGAGSLLPVAGSQAAIHALPRLRPRSRVSVADLSYNEYAHAWGRSGHDVASVAPDRFEQSIERSDVIIICNPNNPTAQTFDKRQLLTWHAALARRGGWLIVDEAYGDSIPANSLAAESERAGLVVLRSLGKFFGLAGARVGFVLAAEPLLGQLREELGPWCISGPARAIAQAALEDAAWQRDTRARLAADSNRLNALLGEFGMAAKGTSLFQWWPHESAGRVHDELARHGILVRLFRGPAITSLRFGLPGNDDEWSRLENALSRCRP